MKFSELKVGQLFSLSDSSEVYIKINPESCVLVHSSRMDKYKGLIVHDTNGTSFNPQVDIVTATFKWEE